MQERRTQTLTEADIAAIVEAVLRSTPHNCRFSNVEPEELSAAISFFRAYTKALDESKSVIRKTLIVIFITAVIGTPTVVGFWGRIKQFLGM